MAQQQQMGLFGVPSASDILRQQQQQDQMLAMRQAQFAPGQGLIYQAASAGQRAGRSIAGLFGIEDPALKEATEMDAVKKVVASQWDGSDPEKALELFVQEANKRGLASQALKASEKLTDLRMKKEEKEATIGLRKAQTKQVEGSESRAESVEKRSQERFDYEKSQRAVDEAKKQIDFIKAVQDVNTKNTQAEAAQIALDKAKAELEAMPEGYFKKQFELKLEKLQADINASKALATYRERPPLREKRAEIPVRDDLGTVVGKTIVYSDGTQETVMGNQPAQGDVASQTARGVNPNSTDFMEQLRAQALAERRRRQQAAGAK